MLLCENSGQNDTKFNNNWATILDDCSDFDLLKKIHDKTKDKQTIYKKNTKDNRRLNAFYKPCKMIKSEKKKITCRLIS